MPVSFVCFFISELTVNFPSTGDWIIGNIQQFGIYRVNYEESNWLELIKQLKSDHKVVSQFVHYSIYDNFRCATAKRTK